MNETLSDKVNTMAGKAQPKLDRMTSMAHDAIDKAAEIPAQAGEWLSDRTEELSARQKKLVEDASSYVSANPLKSIGIAVVAALVVGRLMR